MKILPTEFASKKPYHILYALFCSQRRLLIAGCLGMIGGSAINLLLPALIRNYLNKDYDSFVVEHVLSLALVFILLFALQGFCFFCRSYYFNILGHKAVCDLRDILYEYILRKQISFFDQKRSTDILARLQQDSVIIQDVLSLRISVFIRYAFQIMGGIIFMFWLSLTLSIATLLVVPVLVGLGYILGKRLKQASKKVQASLAEAGVDAEESFRQIETVKAYSLESRLSVRYREGLEKVLQYAKERSFVSAFFSSFVSFLINAALVLVLLFGISLVMNAKVLTLGDLTAFILYGLLVAVSLALFANSISEIVNALGAIERLQELFADNSLDAVEKLQKGPAIKNVDIKFTHVSFSYPSRKNEQVLDDVSLVIEHGKHTAIVGTSGSGKSTLIKLILGLYQPDKGSIAYGDTPSEKVCPLMYGSNIAYLPQEPGLFAMSIVDNLKLAKADASIDEIRSVCEQVNILSFIESLPDGFDTFCGEEGTQLSGGQKQRIAIARALLRDPDVMILDEPSSALDAQNESKMLQTIRRVMQGKTLITISHRQSSILHADQVVLMEDGKVIAKGAHETLFSDNALYKDIVTQH